MEMQKNNMTLHKQKMNEFDIIKFFSLASITAALANTNIMKQLANLYTELLNHKISAKQAVYTFYAQATLIVALLPFHMNLGWRILFIYLFWQAIKQANIMQTHWRN